MEPGVLFPEKRESIGMLDDLHTVRRIQASRHSERQAASSIVTVLLGIVGFPFGQTFFGIGKIVCLRLPFRIRQGLAFVWPIKLHERRWIQSIRASNARHIWRVRVVPMSAEIGLAVCETWGRTRWGQIGCSASSSTATAAPTAGLSGWSG